MAKNQRVVFSFDPHSLEKLKELTEEGRFASMAEAVRESLQMRRAFHKEAKNGFTEIVARNPDTREERILVIPAR